MEEGDFDLGDVGDLGDAGDFGGDVGFEVGSAVARGGVSPAIFSVEKLGETVAKTPGNVKEQKAGNQPDK